MYRYAKFTTINDSADIVVRKDAVDAVYSNGEDKTHSIICLTGGKTYEVQESVAEVMSKLRGRWYEQPAENLKLDDITLCLLHKKGIDTLWQLITTTVLELKGYPLTEEKVKEIIGKCNDYYVEYKKMLQMPAETKTES